MYFSFSTYWQNFHLSCLYNLAYSFNNFSNIFYPASLSQPVRLIETWDWEYVLGILNQPYCLLTIRLNGNKKVKTQIVSQTVMTWQALKKSWNVSYKTWRKHSATTRNKKNLKYIEVVKLWISYKRCFRSSFSLKI